MAKWKITSYDRSHRETGTRQVEADGIDAARAQADRVENDTGAKFTTIARQTDDFGFVAQPRR